MSFAVKVDNFHGNFTESGRLMPIDKEKVM
jgi:hypothetical protein